MGIQDPEQWLEDVPARVFDRWDAAYSLEPWGGEREILARILSMLVIIATKDSGDVKSVMNAANDITKSFMPASWIGQTPMEENKKDSIKSFEEFVSKAFG